MIDCLTLKTRREDTSNDREGYCQSKDDHKNHFLTKITEKPRQGRAGVFRLLYGSAHLSGSFAAEASLGDAGSDGAVRLTHTAPPFPSPASLPFSWES